MYCVQNCSYKCKKLFWDKTQITMFLEEITRTSTFNAYNLGITTADAYSKKMPSAWRRKWIGSFIMNIVYKNQVALKIQDYSCAMAIENLVLDIGGNVNSILSRPSMLKIQDYSTSLVL